MGNGCVQGVVTPGRLPNIWHLRGACRGYEPPAGMRNEAEDLAFLPVVLIGDRSLLFLIITKTSFIFHPSESMRITYF